MAAMQEGDPLAVRRLFDIFYPELRRLAAIRMRGERVAHSWQPTALVNELYLEFVKVRSLRLGGDAQQEKESFLRLAAFLMRRLLIHHARPLTQKMRKIGARELPAGESAFEELLDIDHALDDLAALDPRLRVVVELRVFEGRTADEIAEELGCSRKTVTRLWNFAQHWLRERLEGEEGE